MSNVSCALRYLLEAYRCCASFDNLSFKLREARITSRGWRRRCAVAGVSSGGDECGEAGGVAEIVVSFGGEGILSSLRSTLNDASST